MGSWRTIRTALVLVALVPSLCFAWGPDGHRIVATIATHYLTPEAKAGVQALLGDQTLADVACWADEVKDDPEYEWSIPLHYANVEPGAESFVLERDCPPEGCVVRAIIDYTKVLRSKEASTTEKTEALKFLVHFVADIHQPLHVSRARDRGGNDIAVEFFHDKTNLHWVWDSGLIRRMKKEWTQYAADLLGTITPEQVADWSRKTNPVDWATESYRLALSHAYAIPKDGVLDQEYLDRNIPVVEERLKMAGVRLAALLNDVFAKDD
jgi:hypothetical protein